MGSLQLKTETYKILSSDIPHKMVIPVKTKRTLVLNKHRTLPRLALLTLASEVPVLHQLPFYQPPHLNIVIVQT